MNPYLIQGPALISFSGGRTSGYMLKHILDAHGGRLPDDVHVAFANTGKERNETLDFVAQCSSRWNINIIWLEYDPEAEFSTRIVSHNSAARSGEPFKAVVDKRGFLPNPVTRFCTIELKIRRFYAYCHQMLGWEHWTSIVGLRADEPKRIAKQMRRNKTARDRWKTDFPLNAAGVTKRHVQAWWKKQPFDLALPNIKGSTPEGNCDLCFLKGEIAIRGILRRRPDLGPWWAEAEAEARAAKPDGARFRIDRPSYAQMMEDAKNQGDMFGDELQDEEESRDCACTD